MQLNRTSANFDKTERNKINQNWETIESDFNNTIEQITDDAFSKVIETSRLNWKEPVDTFDDLPSAADTGDTRMARDTGKVYHFTNQTWNEIQQIDAGPVNELDTRLTSQLADKAPQTEIVRINSELAENEKLNTQGGSLVEKMLGMINTKGMYIKVEETTVKVGLNLLDEQNSCVEYNFLKNGDNLLLLRGADIGVVNEPYPAITLTGAFIQTSPPKIYTTTIGDKFTFTFEGTGFDFRRAIDVNGGMWEFRLNNGESKTISCYAPTMNNYTRVPVFKDLEFGTYTVTATFLGQDPLHPVTTPRGYLMYDSASVPPLNQPIIIDNPSKMISGTGKKPLISNSSVIDFAVSASPKDSGQKVEWVPQHGTISGVSRLIDRKILIDGVVINPTTYRTYGNIKSFEIIQAFHALNPNGASGNLWVHYVSHKISMDKPYVEISNRLEFLQDTRITAMYLTMLPVVTSNISRLVLNDGTEYNSILVDNAYVNLDKDVTSAMFVGEYTPGVFHACAVDTLSYAEAAGLKKRSLDVKPITVHFGSVGITKFYINAFIGDALTGDVFRNTQRISVVNGVRYPNSFLKTI